MRAVFQGTVLFSQWFKGYGNLIILDHGNRVFSLYGNVLASTVAVGDRITTGQVIAGVGENEDAEAGLLAELRREDAAAARAALDRKVAALDGLLRRGIFDIPEVRAAIAADRGEKALMVLRGDPVNG